VAKSAADGYTILVANNTIVIQAAMSQALPFDRGTRLHPDRGDCFDTRGARGSSFAARAGPFRT
jgi:hypothetical protein